MCYLADEYKVFYGSRKIGTYLTYTNSQSRYHYASDCPWDIGKELSELGLDKDIECKKQVKVFSDMIKEENRVQGRKRIIYKSGELALERVPRNSVERFSVYRRAADEGEPDYSPLPHDAPHYEGPHTPEGMREWTSWYAFDKMDDGTFEAVLDEGWWWGGGHNDGGTIHSEIPEEWFGLSYEDFLGNVVKLSAAAHYGFTPELLLEREGLKEFFGF